MACMKIHGYTLTVILLGISQLLLLLTTGLYFGSYSTLFSFCINSLVNSLSDPSFYPPSLASILVSVLPYAAVLLSQNCIGLKHMLRAFAACCNK